MTTTIAAALLTLAVASVLIATNSHMGLAFAARKVVGNEVTNTMVQSSDSGNSPNTQSDHTTDLSDNTGTDATFSKDLKKFSKCLTAVAADGDLALAEVTDCYHQVF